MENPKTLNDYFPQWKNAGGVISAINYYCGDHPFGTVADAGYLDLQYHGNHSGEKIVSPLLRKLADIPATTEQVSIIANVIWKMYFEKWAKYTALDDISYNPLENYSMTEEMTDDVTEDEYGHQIERTLDTDHTKTGTETTTRTGTDTQTHTGTDTVTPDLETTDESKVSGFNSENFVNSDKVTTQATGTNETEYDTQLETTHDTQDEITHNVTDADDGTITDVHSGTDTHTRNYTLTRSGNIGVTTSQQMLEAERNILQWNFFEKVVFPDLDRILTIQTY